MLQEIKIVKKKKRTFIYKFKETRQKSNFWVETEDIPWAKRACGTPSCQVNCFVFRPRNREITDACERRIVPNQPVNLKM